MRRVALLAVLLGLAALADAQSLRGIRKDFAEIGEAVIPATVIVKARTAPAQFGGSSGVIVSEDGYVLSDADATLTGFQPDPDDPKNPKKNVKTHGREAVVRLPAPDHRVFRATLVRRDAESDTSLLRIEDPPKDLPFVRVGRSDPLRVGSFLVVTGNSFGTGVEAEPSLSMGVASALLPRKESGGGKYQTIYTSAAVTVGSNGGPVVGLSGRIVGIVSTYERDSTSPYRAFGKVTPIDWIRSRYADIDGAQFVFAPPDSAADQPRDASALEDAFEILGRHLAPSLASLTIDRGDEQGTMKVMTRTGPADIPRYPGPYSALVLTKDGELLTAASNLWAADKIESITATVAGGRTLPAKIVARDSRRGVALLTVEADDLVPPPRAPEDDFVVGRFALAMGNPFGEARPTAPLLTFGIISDLHRVDPSIDAVQTDAGMNDGMVGGALVTLEGKLLGLNILVNPERYGRQSGIGFAVPMSKIDEMLPGLRDGKSVVPGFLGVTGLGKGPKGYVFRGVTPGGPAEKAGLEAGDILLNIDDRAASEFPTPAHLGGYIRSKNAGDTLLLRVERGGLIMSIEVVLAPYPGA